MDLKCVDNYIFSDQYIVTSVDGYANLREAPNTQANITAPLTNLITILTCLAAIMVIINLSITMPPLLKLILNNCMQMSKIDESLKHSQNSSKILSQLCQHYETTYNCNKKQ